MTVTIVILLRFLNLTYLKIHECGRYSYMELTLNLVWRAMAIALLGLVAMPHFSLWNNVAQAQLCLPISFRCTYFFRFRLTRCPPPHFVDS
jgi:hypothetical protein